MTTPEGVIQESNRVAAVLLQVPQGFLVGKALPVFVAQEDRRAFRTQLARLTNLERVRDWEVRLRPHKGESFPVAITVAAARDSGGKVVSLRWLIRDITERVRAEEKVRKAYEEILGRQEAVLSLTEDLRNKVAERERAEEELRQSHTKLQIALEGTVHTLIATIEIRDPYTAGHQRRVTQLACAIAKEMGFPEDRIEGLRMAGLIHDLGKITVPSEILSKPGRLSDLEYGLIQAHAQVGYDILKDMDFPWPLADIVLQHHERLDGSGYPQGLPDEEIMVEARILAVADVVAAMASNRPYRPARGLDKALEEISQNRSVLYDSEVVDACLELFTKKGFAFE